MTFRKKEPKHLFRLGQVVATPAALEALRAEDVNPADLLERHVVGDWGDVCPENAALNLRALEQGGRLMSVYFAGPEEIWVITEWDRRVTSILLPSDN